MSDTTDRLIEIRTEAAAIAADTELAPTDRLEKLNALKAEKAELEAALEAEAVAAELAAEPTVEAEDAAETTGGDQEASNPEAVAADSTPEAPAEPEAVENVVEFEAEAAPSDEQVGEAIAAAATPDAPTPTEGDTWAPSITASANMEGMRVGDTMTHRDFQKVTRAAITAGGESRSTYGSIPMFPEGTPTLNAMNSAWQNTAILAAGGGIPASITAAACFCGPDEAVKDIAQCGIDDRPVLGTFRTSPINGRFNYVRPLGISDTSDGVKIWECSDQDAVDPIDPSTWKPCIDLDCAAEINVEPYTITQCGLFTKQQQMSHPQLVDEFLSKLGIAYARKAETQLLDQIVAGSRVFNVSVALGILDSLKHVGGQLTLLRTFADRIASSGYIAVVPVGLVDALVTDQQLQGAVADMPRSEILNNLADVLGVGSIVETHDADTAATAILQSAIAGLPPVGTPTAWSAAANTPASWPVYIYNPAAYRAGLGEVVEAGFQTDSQLTRQNKVQHFFEGIEVLEKVNCHESFTLNVTACASGAAPELVAGPACA